MRILKLYILLLLMVGLYLLHHTIFKSNNFKIAFNDKLFSEFLTDSIILPPSEKTFKVKVNGAYLVESNVEWVIVAKEKSEIFIVTIGANNGLERSGSINCYFIGGLINIPITFRQLAVPMVTINTSLPQKKTDSTLEIN